MGGQMLKRCMILGLLVLALPQMGYADEASHRAAAKEFIAQTHIPEIADAAMRDAISSSLATIPNQEQYKDIIEDVIRQNLAFSKVEDQYIDLHVKLFTEQELQDLIAFCKTPTGKKYVEASPVLNKEMTNLMIPLIQQTMEELSKRLSERAKELRAKEKKP